MREKLIQWLSEIVRGDSVYEFIQPIEGSNGPNGEYKEKISIYTHDFTYHISAIYRNESDNYLGCTCTVRKPRAGEDWNRGCDLPDGKFTESTWNSVKNAIIANELVKIAKKSRYSDSLVTEHKSQNNQNNVSRNL